MLEDAVEEVPEGVWEGVSGALDKAAGKKKAPPVFWWRMFAGVAAAAAAVALGVFLWPDRKGDFGKVESPDSGPVAVVIPSEPDPGVLTPEITSSAPVTAFAVQENEQNSGRSAVSSRETTENLDDKPEITGSSTNMDENLDREAAYPEKQADSWTEQPGNVVEMDREAITPQAKEQIADNRQPDAQPADGQLNGQREEEEPAAPARVRRERVRYISEDVCRAGQVSLSLSGNAFASGKPSTETPGVTRMAAPAKFWAPAATGITPVSKEASYGLPFTVGIGAKYYVLPRFAVGTGVNYSLLVRSFVGTYNEVSTSVEDGVEHSALVRSVTSDIFNDQHYIGVPLTLFYDFVQTGRVRAYVRADGMVEKNVRCHYRFHSASEKMSYVEKVKGVQWSAGAGLGIEVRLGKYVGIYADPGVRYYFKGNQPASLRTAQPLMMDINAGVRFNIN